MGSHGLRLLFADSLLFLSRHFFGYGFRLRLELRFGALFRFGNFSGSGLHLGFGHHFLFAAAFLGRGSLGGGFLSGSFDGYGFGSSVCGTFHSGKLRLGFRLAFLLAAALLGRGSFGWRGVGLGGWRSFGF